jgi:hypothetical protein
MKRKLVLISFLLAISSNNVFAGTSGSYIGVDFADVNSKSSLNSLYSGNFKDNTQALGISYKYAFNLFGFFAAPTVFVENVDSKSYKNSDEGSIDIKSKYKYGSRLNLGYDITDYLGLYAIAGASKNYYETFISNARSGTFSNKDSKLSGLYGLGFIFNTPIASVSLEYELQSQKIVNEIKNKTSSVRFNVSYRL